MSSMFRLRRLVSLMLIITLVLQSVDIAWAGGITAADKATVIRQQNGKTIIDIAGPNKSGISHNHYKNFNVDAAGVTLNNLVKDGNGALANPIKGNANLKGKAAELIINEVTGSSRSEIKGQLDVAGHRAAVMIANPNGISCDGCSFTNTAGVTLTTGKPTLDKQGALSALEVKGGNIVIGSHGLKGTVKDYSGKTPDYIELISHVATLEGRVEASQLNVTLGRNRVDYAKGTTTALDNDKGYKAPTVALDSKGVGGMYANRIRLVATEKGIGVNTGSMESRQGDITLDSAGNLTAASVKAKQNLDIRATKVNLASGKAMTAGNDITVITPELDNAGTLKAGNDMRLLTGHVANHGDKALLQAHDTLTIQKDAAGNRNSGVLNSSGTIKTEVGDLIIRTNTLKNQREKADIRSESVNADSTDISHNRYRHSTPYTEGSVGGAITEEINPHSFGIDKWFGHVDLVEDGTFNVSRAYDKVLALSREPEIVSGHDLYANTHTLINDKGKISAIRNAYLAGNTFNSYSLVRGQSDHYKVLDGDKSFLTYGNKLVPDRKLSRDKVKSWKLTRDYEIWKELESTPATVTAGNDLVMDFKDQINVGGYNRPAVNYEHQIHDPATSLKGHNVLLNSRDITLNSGIEGNTIKLLADDHANLKNARVNASTDLWISANHDISVVQTRLDGDTISLVSREGNLSLATDLNSYHINGAPGDDPSLHAGTSLMLQAGKDIDIRNIGLIEGKDITLQAGNNITMAIDQAQLDRWGGAKGGDENQKRDVFNYQLDNTNILNASHDLFLIAQGNMALSNAKMNVGHDLSLSAGGDIASAYFMPQDHGFLSEDDRNNRLGAQLHAKHNVSVNSGRDLKIDGSHITADHNLSLSAGRDLGLQIVSNIFRDGSDSDDDDDRNREDHHYVTRLNSGQDMSLAANGKMDVIGSRLIAGRDLQLSSLGKMTLGAMERKQHTLISHGYEDHLYQTTADLEAGRNMGLVTQNSLLFQATTLHAKNGSLKAAAKGGFLFAQAREESSHSEVKKKKKKGGLGGALGGHKTVTKTEDSVTNKVVTFTASQNIELLSRDDTTLEASKVSAGKNAKIISEKGKVNFVGVKDSEFKQKITQSSGFYITSADQGYKKDTWRLPVINVGGKLTVDTAKGITADIKKKDGQTLTNAVNELSQQPGMEWLKNLNGRKDVQWNTVQDAYSSWHHSQKSLNPVVAAVIAIAAAAATSGAGVAALGTTAATSASGAVVSGAASAGMMALASQAAVALVDNEGNLSKTFKALSSSNSVKSIISSMVIGGAMGGFDEVVSGTPPTPGSGTRPILNSGDWSKVTQRMAAQSLVESGTNQAVYGGSFRDQLTNALLGNIGEQVQAQGAQIIGDNGDVLGPSRKTISHAVLADISAEIGSGNRKGAVAGAIAAELAGINMHDSLEENANWKEQEASLNRVLGAIAGALASGKASGADSGAQSAEIVDRFNRQLHENEEKIIKDQAAGNKVEEEKLRAAACRAVRCTAQESLSSEDRKYYSGLMDKYPESATLAEENMLYSAYTKALSSDFGSSSNLLSPDGDMPFFYGLSDYGTDGTDFLHNQSIASISHATGFSSATVSDVADAMWLAGQLFGPGKGKGVVSTEKYVGDAFAKLSKETQKRIFAAETVPSTAKKNQSPIPRDIVESVLWNHVENYPSLGEKIDFPGGAKDPNFKPEDGFQKMKARAEFENGKDIEIHYQYNKYTDRAYDVKITSHIRK